MEENFKRQVEEYQLQLNEMNKEAERKKLEQEKINREKKMKEEIEQIEEEKLKKKREAELREKNENKKRDEILKNKNFIQANEKLKNNLVNLLKKISKLEIIIHDLRRKINLKVTIQKNFGQESSEFDSNNNLMIRVENYEEGTVYYWNLEKFQNRYDQMKELFNKFNKAEFSNFGNGFKTKIFFDSSIEK